MRISFNGYGVRAQNLSNVVLLAQVWGAVELGQSCGILRLAMCCPPEKRFPSTPLTLVLILDIQRVSNLETPEVKPVKKKIICKKNGTTVRRARREFTNRRTWSCWEIR